MAIKFIAFDFDGVIPLEEAPLFLCEKLGKKRESDALSNEYYSGLSSAKKEWEKEAVPRIVWEKTMDIYRPHSVRKLKAIINGLGIAKGAKEAFSYFNENGIRIGIFSATIGPLIRWFASRHKLLIDDYFTSECEISNGRLGRLGKVLSPREKERMLNAWLLKNKAKKTQCLVVGDSFSEVPMFELVGKQNSVAFNYRQDLTNYCNHLLFKQNDPNRDLRKIIEIVEKMK
ncbi:haloacid dehalogenase-like hydrolase [Candidatus Micrarchaeota archaeon]|nr:haloacid dehalogenase-like hydrolase [Candidatus Micrarchaeota archaeon]